MTLPEPFSIRRSFFAVLAVMAGMVLVSCNGGSSGGAMINVCNLDNEEYRVELRRAGSDRAVQSFTLEEWYDFGDYCDDFEDVGDGRYYIWIQEKGNFNNTDRTASFYLDDDDYIRYYTIDSTGSLSGDGDEDDEGTIMVCNEDDEAYWVELRHADNGDFVTDFFLKEIYHLNDRCDEFRDINAGEYYLVIEHEKTGGRTASGDFYLDGGEFENFIIDDTGRLRRR